MGVRIVDMTELSATPASDDLFEVVDISDTTDDATGTSKKVTRTNLLGDMATDAELSSHESDTTNVHGIADTGTLVVNTAVPFTFTVVLSDETTALTTGTKLVIRAPFAMSLYAGNAGCRAHVTGASSSGAPQVDVQEAGVSIMSTKLTIDQGEKTSLSATTAVVLSDTSIADDAELSFIVDTSGTGTLGLKVTLRGTRSV